MAVAFGTKLTAAVLPATVAGDEEGSTSRSFGILSRFAPAEPRTTRSADTRHHLLRSRRPHQWNPGASVEFGRGELSTSMPSDEPVVRVGVQELFERIVRRDPVLRTPSGRESTYRAWREIGEIGAWWLIQRLAEPTDERTSWMISDVLSAMGASAASPVTRSLANGLPAPQAAALFSALAGMVPSEVRHAIDRLPAIIQQYLSHADDMVRVRAANATDLLPRNSAATLLRAALATETDERVRDELRDLLCERGLD